MKTYKHIYVNSHDHLQVLMPIVRGDTIGLDNTCQSGTELKLFFADKSISEQDINGTTVQILLDESVFASLIKLKTDIESKYLISCTSRDQIRYLQKLHEQVIKYQNDLTEIKDWGQHQFSSDFSNIPKEVLSVLSVDPYVGAIGLDPMVRDDFLRLREVSDCTFGIRGSEGQTTQILSSALRSFFIENKNVISKSHSQWMASLKEEDNRTWKKSFLSHLSKLIDKEKFESQGDMLEFILKSLNTFFKERQSIHNPTKLFKDSLKGKGYTGDVHNNADVCEYFKTVIGLDEDESLKYEDLITYVKYFIQWDNLEVFPEREKGVFEEVHESGDGFDGSQNTQNNYEERMNVAVQFLLGTANLVLKRKGKTESNFGRIIEGVVETKEGLACMENRMIESLLATIIKNISVTEVSVVHQLFDTIVGWLNDNSEELAIQGGITDDDAKEIKQIFSGNFRTIKGSPHFDEFLVRQEGGALWKRVEGSIVTDVRNLLKHGFNKKVDENTELVSDLISVDEKLNNLHSKGFMVEDDIDAIIEDFKSDRTIGLEKLFLVHMFFEEIKKGNLKGVEKFLDLGFINAVDESGITALMMAAGAGHVDIVGALIQANADLDMKDVSDRTGIMIAAMNGNIDVVKMLMAANVDLNDHSGMGKNALMAAMMMDNLDLAKVLIHEKTEFPLNINNISPVLVVASIMGRNEFVEFLLQQKVDINFQDTNDLSTSLIGAVKMGHVEIVKSLTKAGADLNIRDLNNLTALDYANQMRQIDQGREKIVKILEDASKRYEAVIKIQKTCRGYHSRMSFFGIKEQTRKEKSAIAIQRCYRKFSGKNDKGMAFGNVVSPS